MDWSDGAATAPHRHESLRTALRRAGASPARWLVLLIASRLAAMVIAAGLIAWRGFTVADVLFLAAWSAATFALASLPRTRRSPAFWAIDSAAALAYVLHSGDWRSPYYLMWLATLGLPSVVLPLAGVVVLAAAACAAFLAVAVLGGPIPGALRLVSTETLAIHASLPFLLVCALGYASHCLRQLAAERTERERLAVEAERRRIAWELHDSAKQRVHVAHLLVSSVLARVPSALRPTVSRVEAELESVAADMDTSLAELRSPLAGRALHVALEQRAAELTTEGGPALTVRGQAPELPEIVAAHAYRITCEAMTNALRHAEAQRIEATLATRPGRLVVEVRDDGRGMANSHPPGTGIVAMTHRAASIGGRLVVSAARGGTGTVVTLLLPIENGDAL